MERFKLSRAVGTWPWLPRTRRAASMLNIINGKTMQWIAQARIDSRGGLADFAWWSTGNGLTLLRRRRPGRRMEHAHEEDIRQLARLRLDRRYRRRAGRAERTRGSGRRPLGLRSAARAASSTSTIEMFSSARRLLRAETTAPKSRQCQKPTRTLEPLITAITAVTFSPDGQILTFASRHRRMHCVLCICLHAQSTETGRHRPTPVGRVTAIAFNSQSDFASRSGTTRAKLGYGTFGARTFQLPGLFRRRQYSYHRRFLSRSQ